MTKKTTIIAIAIVMLIAAVSCSGSGIEKTAENALKEKYGVSFKALESEKMDSDSAYVWLRPDGIPDAVVKSAVNDDGSGLLDNYITVRLCHETTDKVKDSLSDYKGDYYVHTDNSLEWTHDTDYDITAAEYVRKNPVDYFVISIILDSKNAVLDALREELLTLHTTKAVGFLLH